MTSKKTDDYTALESKNRFEAALRGARIAGHKPMESLTQKKQKVKKPGPRKKGLMQPAMRDQWTEFLRCPSCRATGTVSLSQENPDSQAYHDGTDQNVRVELVPIGFRAVTNKLGSEFYCIQCGVAAHHE